MIRSAAITPQQIKSSTMSPSRLPHFDRSWRPHPAEPWTSSVLSALTSSPLDRSEDGLRAAFEFSRSLGLTLGHADRCQRARRLGCRQALTVADVEVLEEPLQMVARFREPAEPPVRKTQVVARPRARRGGAEASERRFELGPRGLRISQQVGRDAFVVVGDRTYKDRAS